MPGTSDQCGRADICSLGGRKFLGGSLAPILTGPSDIDPARSRPKDAGPTACLRTMVYRGRGARMCKVLLVDDEPDVRESLSIELASLGHDVIAAPDGVEALSWLTARQPNVPCVVLLDLRMPRMDGWDFLQRLRSKPEWTRLPVVVLSATLKRGCHAPVLPAQAFWQKPPQEEQIQSLHRYCDRHHPSGVASVAHERDRFVS